jgi:hypothetical protein
MPAILLSMSGHRLTVSAAIYTDAVFADEFLSLSLSLGLLGPENVLRVARIFFAINRCADKLRLRYRSLETLALVDPDVIFPRPTPDPLDAEFLDLKFFTKVDRVNGTPIDTVAIPEDDRRHGIYLARAQIGGAPTEVLVKFTPRYNRDAHYLLANHDPPLAPALHFCGRVVGGLYMVVMEYIADASPLHRFFPPSPLPRAPAPDVVLNTLKQALELLHGSDIVFGDLRPPNILYKRDEDRVFLVDFDRTGKDGEARYSPCLNRELKLGEDVRRWAVMKKSHDDDNLKRVMEWLSDVMGAVGHKV